MPAQIFISLNEQERVELENVVSSRMTSVRLVTRAKGIRMAATKTPSVMSFLICRNEKPIILPHFKEGCDATDQVQGDVERAGTRHAP